MDTKQTTACIVSRMVRNDSDSKGKDKEEDGEEDWLCLMGGLVEPTDEDFGARLLAEIPHHERTVDRCIVAMEKEDRQCFRHVPMDHRIAIAKRVQHGFLMFPFEWYPPSYKWPIDALHSRLVSTRPFPISPIWCSDVPTSVITAELYDLAITDERVNIMRFKDCSEEVMAKFCTPEKVSLIINRFDAPEFPRSNIIQRIINSWPNNCWSLDIALHLVNKHHKFFEFIPQRILSSFPRNDPRTSTLFRGGARTCGLRHITSVYRTDQIIDLGLIRAPQHISILEPQECTESRIKWFLCQNPSNVQYLEPKHVVTIDMLFMVCKEVTDKYQFFHVSNFVNELMRRFQFFSGNSFAETLHDNESLFFRCAILSYCDHNRQRNGARLLTNTRNMELDMDDMFSLHEHVPSIRYNCNSIRAALWVFPNLSNRMRTIFPDVAIRRGLAPDFVEREQSILRKWQLELETALPEHPFLVALIIMYGC